MSGLILQYLVKIYSDYPFLQARHKNTSLVKLHRNRPNHFIWPTRKVLMESLLPTFTSVLCYCEMLNNSVNFLSI